MIKIMSGKCLICFYKHAVQYVSKPSCTNADFSVCVGQTIFGTIFGPAMLSTPSITVPCISAATFSPSPCRVDVWNYGDLP